MHQIASDFIVAVPFILGIRIADFIWPQTKERTLAEARISETVGLFSLLIITLIALAL